jgi:hypothetical protein
MQDQLQYLDTGEQTFKPYQIMERVVWKLDDRE